MPPLKMALRLRSHALRARRAACSGIVHYRPGVNGSWFVPAALKPRCPLAAPPSVPGP